MINVLLIVHIKQTNDKFIFNFIIFIVTDTHYSNRLI